MYANDSDSLLLNEEKGTNPRLNGCTNTNKTNN